MQGNLVLLKDHRIGDPLSKDDLTWMDYTKERPPLPSKTVRGVRVGAFIPALSLYSDVVLEFEMIRCFEATIDE